MAFPPTDWGNFTPEEYEVGAPATSNHFERWFRNLVAAYQGAPDAPGLVFRALAIVAAGDVAKLQQLPVVAGSDIFTDVLTAVFLNSGTLRARPVCPEAERS
ncbi:hypothetical protein [Paracoccus sp. IB05]|uniref:hypothetical protein n=1 Tax=Paracoccus sp. IB05 TaxID=2779367 RepID=UPI0018E7C5B2|nr:hypothetical protein [Paracoccus sp. IB05]MBJ2154089.1 hypothetical protein [Paracoccus sp. IB05]